MVVTALKNGRNLGSGHYADRKVRQMRKIVWELLPALGIEMCRVEDPDLAKRAGDTEERKSKLFANAEAFTGAKKRVLLHSSVPRDDAVPRTRANEAC